MKKATYIIFVLFLISCEREIDYKKPENLIPKEQMIDLLYDIHIANSTVGIKNTEGEKKRNYMALVYEKYKIDSTQFMTSNTYYVANIKEYQAIFKAVESRLGKVKEEMETKQDSINETKLDTTRIKKPIKNREKLKLKNERIQ